MAGNAETGAGGADGSDVANGNAFGIAGKELEHAARRIWITVVWEGEIDRLNGGNAPPFDVFRAAGAERRWRRCAIWHSGQWHGRRNEVVDAEPGGRGAGGDTPG